MKAESVNGVGKKVKQIPEVKLKGWTKKLFFNPGNPRTPNPNKRKAAATIAPDAYDSTKKRAKLTKDVTDEQMPINLENITEQPEIPQNRTLNTIEPTVENKKTNEKPKSKKRAKTETKENTHKVTDENSKNALPSISKPREIKSDKKVKLKGIYDGKHRSPNKFIDTDPKQRKLDDFLKPKLPKHTKMKELSPAQTKNETVNINDSGEIENDVMETDETETAMETENKKFQEIRKKYQRDPVSKFPHPKKPNSGEGKAYK